MEKIEKYFTIDSDLLIKTLIEQEYIELIGTGSRFDDKFNGLHNELWKTDNSFNWEIMEEDEDNDGNTVLSFYSLSHCFEIRETDDILILSKHIGTDIRAGYEDEQIFVKNKQKFNDVDMGFYFMIQELRDDLAVEDE